MQLYLARSTGATDQAVARAVQPTMKKGSKPYRSMQVPEHAFARACLHMVSLTVLNSLHDRKSGPSLHLPFHV